ncbi:MAG TPA: ATP-binding protein [Burkholderiales bacterium]|nr:ATP-binding protein [Burkholderiales bacterium]
MAAQTTIASAPLANYKGVPDTFGAPSIGQKIRAEQIRAVYLYSPTIAIGSLVAAASLLWVVRNDVPILFQLGWLVAMVAHQGFRIFHYRNYLKANPDPTEAPYWGRRYIVTTIVAGMLWGGAGVLFYAPDSVVQTYLCMVLFAVASLSIQALSIFAPAFYPLILLTLTPFIVRATIGGTPHELALVVPTTIALFIGLSFGRRTNVSGYESIRRRFENLDLIVALRRQREIADKARMQAEAANRSKTQFFAAASHDLRQPLHAMGLFAAALTERIHDPEVLNVVNSINASVDALEGLFNELLDISKIDAGVIRAEPTDFHINRVLDRLRLEFEPEAFEKGLSLRIVPSGQVIHSDPMLLERILRNLVSNAIRYTEEGGIVVGCRPRGNLLSVEVWDTGVGIAPEQRERVFEEFYQIGNPERTSRKGLGLGLSIVRRLTNLLGANMNMHSIPGKGSVFKLELPRGHITHRKNENNTNAETHALDLRGKLIVVIDDEGAIVEGMRVLLNSWGAEVIGSTTGADVLERVHQAERLPDLIIADYRLGDGYTGTTVVEKLRQALDPEIPAILVTGSTTPDRIEEAKLHGFHLLLKPVLPAKLRTLINFKLKRGAD